MDYQNHYNTLINRSKNRILEGYTEKHHILPRCLDGGDGDENIAILTAREHYIAHQLLVKIYPDEYKLVLSANMMCTFRQDIPRSRNRLYGWLREKLSEEMRKKQTGKGNNMYGTMWITNGEDKIRIKKTDQIPEGWHKGRILIKCKRCECLLETRRQYCDACKKERVNEKSYKISIDYLIDFMDSDFDSVTLFAESIGTSQPNISQNWKRNLPFYDEMFEHGKVPDKEKIKDIIASVA